MTWSLGAGIEGRGVIVTGATGGIGQPVCEAFAAAGARVLAVDLDQDRVDALVSSLEGDGHDGLGVDIADLTAHDRIIRRALDSLGSLYVLANLAAVLRRRADIDDITEEDWDIQSDVNLKGAFFLARAAGKAMIDQDAGGRIITFASQGWWTGGYGGSVAYSATKGGIVSMTRGLARTYGPHGITVNSVAPGQVSTAMLLTGLDPDVYEQMRQQTPLRYVAEPHQLAGTVVFLASQHADYISGATINVSGGFLMY